MLKNIAAARAAGKGGGKGGGRGGRGGRGTGAVYSDGAAAEPAVPQAHVEGLLRAQEVAGVAALYAFAPPAGPGLPHVSLELINYAHCVLPVSNDALISIVRRITDNDKKRPG